MTSQENRQARRVLRAALSMERIVFDLVQELQDRLRDHEEVINWPLLDNILDQVREFHVLQKDLVANIRRELNV